MSKSHPNQERGVVWWARNVGRYRVAEMNPYAKRDPSFILAKGLGRSGKQKQQEDKLADCFWHREVAVYPICTADFVWNMFLGRALGRTAAFSPEPELELPGSDQEFNKFFVGVREFLTGVWAECGRSAQRPT